ncbi:MAG: hypothetical protein HQL16_06915, partial [Candidatus Omnitrophica bacterium]|nr:hypothetical protein [Candidatus Omnitrophota bacterium]
MGRPEKPKVDYDSISYFYNIGEEVPLSAQRSFPSQEQKTTQAAVNDIFGQIAGQDNADSKNPVPPVEVYGEEYFHSRFAEWIRGVAIVVLCTFIPDQVSWAFNYNPVIIYGPKLAVNTEAFASMTPAQLTAMQVSGGVEHLLKQVADKDSVKLELQLDENKNFLGLGKYKGHTLALEAKTPITSEKIKEVKEWLADPSIHADNCGVFAFKDILNAEKIEKSLSEISMMTIMVDVMQNVTKPGDKRLKTSLLALSESAKALGLNYKPVKINPKNILTLSMPFIAHLSDEHFVTVLKADGDTVVIKDIGVQGKMTREELFERATGYVLAKNMDYFLGAGFEEVSPTMQTFVWGDKWRNRSDDLPGLLTAGQVFMQVFMQFAMAFLGMLLGGLFSGAGAAAGVGGEVAQMGASMQQFSIALTIGVSTFSSTAAEACILAEVCDERTGFILNIALNTSLTLGAISGANAATEGGDVLGAFFKGAAQGLAIGIVKGFVMYEVYKIVYEAMGGDSKKSNAQTIIQQTMASFASSVAGSIATTAMAYLVDAQALIGDGNKSFGEAMADEMKKAFITGVGKALGALMRIAVGGDPDSVMSKAMGIVGDSIGSGIMSAMMAPNSDVSMGDAILRAIIQGAISGLIAIAVGSAMEAAIGKDDGSKAYKYKRAQAVMFGMGLAMLGGAIVAAALNDSGGAAGGFTEDYSTAAGMHSGDMYMTVTPTNISFNGGSGLSEYVDHLAGWGGFSVEQMYGSAVARDKAMAAYIQGGDTEEMAKMRWLVGIEDRVWNARIDYQSSLYESMINRVIANSIGRLASAAIGRENAVNMGLDPRALPQGGGQGMGGGGGDNSGGGGDEGGGMGGGGMGGGGDEGGGMGGGGMGGGYGDEGGGMGGGTGGSSEQGNSQGSMGSDNGGPYAPEPGSQQPTETPQGSSGAQQQPAAGSSTGGTYPSSGSSGNSGDYGPSTYVEGAASNNAQSSGSSSGSSDTMNYGFGNNNDYNWLTGGNNTGASNSGNNGYGAWNGYSGSNGYGASNGYGGNKGSSGNYVDDLFSYGYGGNDMGYGGNNNNMNYGYQPNWNPNSGSYFQNFNTNIDSAAGMGILNPAAGALNNGQGDYNGYGTSPYYGAPTESPDGSKVQNYFNDVKESQENQSSNEKQANSTASSGSSYSAWGQAIGSVLPAGLGSLVSAAGVIADQVSATSGTDAASIQYRQNLAQASAGLIPLSNEQAAYLQGKGQDLSYVERPWFSSNLGLSEANQGANYGWTMSGYLTNDVLHPWADKTAIAQLNQGLVGLSPAGRTEYIEQNKDAYIKAGAISIYNGNAETMVDNAVKQGDAANFYYKNYTGTQAGLQTGYQTNTFTGLTDWNNAQNNVAAWQNQLPAGVSYVGPNYKPDGEVAPVQKFFDYSGGITAEIKNPLFTSQVQGTGSGLGMQLAGGQTEFAPFDSFHKASGNISSQLAGGTETLQSTINGAGIRYDAAGKGYFGVTGQGGIYDAFPGMKMPAMGGNGANGANGGNPFAGVTGSNANYTIDIFKNANGSEYAKLNGKTEMMLPGFDLNKAAEHGYSYQGSAVANNFATGASAQFGSTITPSNPIHLFNTNNSFWGNGVYFGPQNSLIPLNSAQNFNEKGLPTYFNTLQVNNQANPEGLARSFQFNRGFDGTTGKMGGLTYSGTSMQSGWQFNKDFTPVSQALQMTTFDSQKMIAPVKTDAFTSNYTNVFANAGQKVLYSSETVNLGGGPGAGAQNLGGKFETAQVRDHVYLSTAIGEGASHIANLNIPEKIATTQQLDQNFSASFSPMYNNARHTFEPFQGNNFVNFVSGVQRNEKGEITGEIIAAINHKDVFLNGKTVDLDKNGFATTDGIQSGWSNINAKASYLKDLTGRNMAVSGEAMLSGVNFRVENGGTKWDSFNVKGLNFGGVNVPIKNSSVDTFGNGKPVIEFDGNNPLVLAQLGSGVRNPGAAGGPSAGTATAPYRPEMNLTNQNGVTYANGLQRTEFGLANLNSPNATLSGDFRNVSATNNTGSKWVTFGVQSNPNGTFDNIRQAGGEKFTFNEAGALTGTAWRSLSNNTTGSSVSAFLKDRPDVSQSFKYQSIEFDKNNRLVEGGTVMASDRSYTDSLGGKGTLQGFSTDERGGMKALVQSSDLTAGKGYKLNPVAVQENGTLATDMMIGGKAYSAGTTVTTDMVKAYLKDLSSAPQGGQGSIDVSKFSQLTLAKSGDRLVSQGQAQYKIDMDSNLNATSTQYYGDTHLNYGAGVDKVAMFNIVGRDGKTMLAEEALQKTSDQGFYLNKDQNIFTPQGQDFHQFGISERAALPGQTFTSIQTTERADNQGKIQYSQELTNLRMDAGNNVLGVAYDKAKPMTDSFAHTGEIQNWALSNGGVRLDVKSDNGLIAGRGVRVDNPLPKVGDVLQSDMDIAGNPYKKGTSITPAMLQGMAQD